MYTRANWCRLGKIHKRPLPNIFLLQYLLDKVDLVVPLTSSSSCRSSPAKAAVLSPGVGSTRRAPLCWEIPREFSIPSSERQMRKGQSPGQREAPIYTNLAFQSEPCSLFLSWFKERWKLWVNDLTVKVPRLMRDIHSRSREIRQWLMKIQLIVYLLPKIHSFNRKQIIFSSSISLSLRAKAHTNIATLRYRHWWKISSVLTVFLFFFHCPLLIIPLLIASFTRSKLSDRAGSYIPTLWFLAFDTNSSMSRLCFCNAYLNLCHQWLNESQLFNFPLLQALSFILLKNKILCWT